MSRFTRFAIATAISLPLVLAPTASNATASAFAIVFTGKAKVTAPLCYVFEVPAVCTPPANAGFTFGAGAKKPAKALWPSLCLGVSVHPKKKLALEPDPSFGPTCSINATGVVDGVLPVFPFDGPTCGLSSGVITAGTIDFQPNLVQTAKKIYSFTGIWPAALGGTIVIVGGVSKPGSIQGAGVVILNAYPSPDKVPSQSCLTALGGPGASNFNVVGAGFGAVIGK